MKTIQMLIVSCFFGFTLKAQISFKLSSTNVVGNAPYSVAAADINGDGKVDLICGNYYGDTLSVLTNNGSGGFVLSGAYPVGLYPCSVVATDVNGDGKVDLICANSGGNTLSVLTNNGSGGFVLAFSPVVGNNPGSVTVADANGDGKVNLICANTGGNTLSVLTNNGSGGFVLASSPNVGNQPVFVTAADVNGDGNVDLISANYTDSTLTVLTNNGSGGVVLAGTFFVGSGPVSVVATNVTGSGRVDLICANWGSGAGNTLTVLTNNGSGNFGSNATINVGSGSISVAAADFNGDGKVNLICANYNDNRLSVLTNNGSGGFVLATNLSVGSLPYFVTAADVNGDGKVDLISANSGDNTLTVLTNATVFPMAAPIPAPAGLVGWWRAEGNANDSVGANNGGLQGGVGFASGEVGQAFSLDGTSGYILVPASPNLNVGLSNGLTIEGWINPATTATLRPIAEWTTGGNIGVHFWISSDNVGVLKVGSLYANVVDTGGGYHSFSSAAGILVTNQFQHVALTYDKSSGMGRLYVNGLVVTQQNLGIFTPKTASNLNLGTRPGTAYFWSGLLDEISVYSRALSSNEIAAIYNAGGAGKYIGGSVPTITSQPQSQTNVLGATVTFQVGATSSIPVNYQWRKSSTNLVDGGNVSGSRTNTLTIMNISASDAGIYSVIVSNANGSVSSSNAVLAVVPPAPAIGTAVLSGSFVTTVNITDGGRGYTNTPLVRLIGGGGSGAGAFAVVSNGVVISITVTNAGFGYTNAPQVVIDPPLIFNPVLAIAPMSFLTYSNLAMGGIYQFQQFVQYYWVNLPVSFTASNSLFTQMVAGAVGSGAYRLALSPVPAQAFAKAQMFNGYVVGATVTNGGSGYVTSPAVTIVGRNIFEAGAYSTISGGVVMSITVTNAGYGYANTPSIQIDPPPAAAVYPAVQPVMRVDSSSLAPYDNYQVQFKPDIMAPWMNWNVGLFSPTAMTNSQFLFITNGVGFFRLQYVP